MFSRVETLSDMPDAIREQIIKHLKTQDDLATDAVRSIVLALHTLERTIEDRNENLTSLGETLTEDTIIKAYNRGKLIDFMCQHLTESHIQNLGVNALGSILSRSYQIEHNSALFILEPENRYEVSWIRWDASLEETLDTLTDSLENIFDIDHKITQFQNSSVMQFSKFLEAHLDGFNEEMQNFIDKYHIALIPISYGEKKIGFFTVLFESHKDQSYVLNVGNLVANAMAEGYAKIWRVNDCRK